MPKQWMDYSPEFQERLKAAVKAVRPHVILPNSFDYMRGIRYACDLSCAMSAISGRKEDVPEDVPDAALVSIAIDGIIEAAHSDAYHEEKERWDINCYGEE